MNDSTDDLRELWQNSAPSRALNVEDLIRRMQKRNAEWERTVARRDLRETIAGVLIFILFTWFACRAADWLIRISELWIAAAGLWIIFWLRRQRYIRKAPSSNQSLATYHEALLESYQHQIQLLQTAKLWYVLPFWSGLMLFSFATWRLRHNVPQALLLVGTFTLTFGLVWWLNESWGVRHIRRKQAELSKLSGAAE